MAVHIYKRINQDGKWGDYWDWGVTDTTWSWGGWVEVVAGEAAQRVAISGRPELVVGKVNGSLMVEYLLAPPGHGSVADVDAAVP